MYIYGFLQKNCGGQDSNEAEKEVKSCLFWTQGVLFIPHPLAFLYIIIYYEDLYLYLSGGHQSAAKENKSRCRIVNQC